MILWEIEKIVLNLPPVHREWSPKSSPIYTTHIDNQTSPLLSCQWSFIWDWWDCYIDSKSKLIQKYIEKNKKLGNYWILFPKFLCFLLGSGFNETFKIAISFHGRKGTVHSLNVVFNCPWFQAKCEDPLPSAGTVSVPMVSWPQTSMSSSCLCLGL